MEEDGKPVQHLLKNLIYLTNRPVGRKKRWTAVENHPDVLIPELPDKLEEQLNTMNFEDFEPQPPMNRKVKVGDVSELFPGMDLPKLQAAHRMKSHRFDDDVGSAPVENPEELETKFRPKIEKLKAEIALLVVKRREKRRQKNLAKRRHIYGEILDTEMTYVRSLKLFLRLYVNEMKRKIPESLHQELNHSIRMILNINEPFMKDMKKKYANHPKVEPIGIPELFISRADDFKLIYSKYSVFFAKTLREISRCQKRDDNLRRFLMSIQRELRRQRERATTIRSFLMMPIQRLPRYKLLLSDLLRKHDAEEEKEKYRQIKKAVDVIEKTTMHINIRKREYEYELKVNDVVRKDPSFKFLQNEKMLSYLVGYLNIETKDPLKVDVFIFEKMILFYYKNPLYNHPFLGKDHHLIQINDPCLRCYLDRKRRGSLMIEVDRYQVFLGCESHQVAHDTATMINKLLKIESLKSYNEFFEREVYFGYLKKEGGGMKSRRLKKRWHVLTADKKMKYYDKERGAFKGSYNLIGARVGVNKTKQYKFGFYVKTTERTFYLKAEKKEEVEEWLVVMAESLGCKRET